MKEIRLVKRDEPGKEWSKATSIIVIAHEVEGDEELTVFLRSLQALLVPGVDVFVADAKVIVDFRTMHLALGLE